MNLSKTSERGILKNHYDLINGILFSWWKDNKVVFFISTLAVVGSEVNYFNAEGRW